MHDFVLEYIHVILAVIIIAQGYILYSQNQIFNWVKMNLFNILQIVKFLSQKSAGYEEILEKLNPPKEK